jgi:hypothetical protein
VEGLVIWYERFGGTYASVFRVEDGDSMFHHNIDSHLRVPRHHDPENLSGITIIYYYYYFLISEKLFEQMKRDTPHQGDEPDRPDDGGSKDL